MKIHEYEYKMHRIFFSTIAVKRYQCCIKYERQVYLLFSVCRFYLKTQHTSGFEQPLRRYELPPGIGELHHYDVPRKEVVKSE